MDSVQHYPLTFKPPMIAQSLSPVVAESHAADSPISLLDDIGNTPLLDLTQFAHSCGVSDNVDLYAKAEWANPGGSVKARAALQIVEEAEADGRLGAGQTLIDSSSGNTAIAYALVGAVRGFPVHLVMPENVSRERKALVKAYGATLIESDPLEGSDGAIRMVRQIVAADPERYFYADQYNNDANWRAHYEGTGPEIWQQTQGRVTHFVAGLGTTGTFVGAGRFLREQNAAAQLVAVQPEDELSVIEGLKYLPTAITPGIYAPSLVDRHMTVSAETAWDVTQALARAAGLFVGFSSGAAVAAAVQVAKELPLDSESVVVTLLPDDGSKYVSLGLFD
ncbi:MAG: cysteine synthase family protein [Caldilineaceae bacterium]|nr:cysteine synthase family protein [Caldilineaceae bacterium]MDE0311926.1 cysteine synthase family protein [Caldilineaceae bacterium]